MARLTRDEIVTEGMLLAGRDPSSTADFTQTVGWLQRWLDSIASSWPWPVLTTVTNSGIVIPAGVNSILFGATNPTTDPTHAPAEKVLEILDGIWLYDSLGKPIWRLRIKPQTGFPDNLTGASQPRIGCPDSLRLFKHQGGIWRLKFDVQTDKVYNVAIPYIYLPLPLASGTSLPWYENDETMVQLVAFRCAEYFDGKDSPVAQAAQQQLASRVAEDRIRFGSAAGINTPFGLDPAMFKQRRP